MAAKAPATRAASPAMGPVSPVTGTTALTRPRAGTGSGLSVPPPVEGRVASAGSTGPVASSG